MAYTSYVLEGGEWQPTRPHGARNLEFEKLMLAGETKTAKAKLESTKNKVSRVNKVEWKRSTR